MAAAAVAVATRAVAIEAVALVEQVAVAISELKKYFPASAGHPLRISIVATEIFY